MKNKLILFLMLLIFKSFGQKIDAPVVSEWKTPKLLSPEYRYNSASIYLVNGSLLPDLFSGNTLTKQERRKYNLKANDYAKYIFLSVEIQHPMNKEILTIPLYLLDVTNKSNQLFTASNMGRILDEIKDDALNFKPLDATGRLKAIKGNSSMEIATQALEISSSLLKTALALKEGPFGANEILQNVRKGAEYFDKMAKDKEVNNEFRIPIIKESDIYKYEIHSVSIHQIKWDFKPAVSDFLTNIQTQEQSLNQILGLINKEHPYLVVVRYKSFYSLPEDYIKNVEIDQNYLDIRQAKLVDFSGMKKELESSLLESIKEAITLKKDYIVYNRDKEVNQINFDVISRMINSYFIIKESYLNEIEKHKTNVERSMYFENYYQEAYRVLFNKLQEYLDSDLKSAKNLVDKYFEIIKTDFTKISESELCINLKSLEYYRDIVQKQQNSNKSITQIAGSRFYPKYNELINKVENSLYDKAFGIEKLQTSDAKVAFLNVQMEAYPCCIICKEKANFVVTQINKITDNARKEQLLSLQREYLVTLKCWDDISNKIISNINTRYPVAEREMLSTIDKKIFKEIEKQHQNIISSSNEYLSIDDVQTATLNSTDLIKELNKYLIIRKTVSQSISILLKNKMIDDASISCFRE